MDIDKIFDTVFVSATSILKLKNARLDTRARDEVKLPQNNLLWNQPWVVSNLILGFDLQEKFLKMQIMKFDRIIITFNVNVS